jgi:hypothetical protein
VEICEGHALEKVAMTDIADDSEFPTLFAHGTRKDWGLGVLAGERDGKRSYLFESGEERIMGTGAYDMMRKVAPLDRDQQAIYARLTALVARRQGRAEPTKAAGSSLLEQLEVLRKEFPQGFLDPGWKNENRAGRVRGQRLQEAQELLSLKALDAHLKAQQFDALWASVTKVLSGTEWLPNDQLKTVATGEGLRNIAGATRELLYGTASQEQRIDRFVAAYELTFHRVPRWETATAISALVFPGDHVLVELASFRKQLKALGAKGTLVARPSGTGYSRCANAARVIASKLAESGEVPQDLLDVHDFVRFTLKPKPPVRRPKPPAKAKAVKAKGVAKDDDDDSAEESSSDED